MAESSGEAVTVSLDKEGVAALVISESEILSALSWPNDTIFPNSSTDIPWRYFGLSFRPLQ